MVHKLFKRTELDTAFYLDHLRHRLPDSIVDMHIHLGLPEFTKNVPQELIANDWAAQCTLSMDTGQLAFYFDQLLPDKSVAYLALPFPYRGTDIRQNNAYLTNNTQHALMCVLPDWDPEYCEETLCSGGFLGFKPYPGLVTTIKGAEISIFDFITHAQLSILNTYKKALTLHLPRKGRLPDDDNIRELRLIKSKYPDIKLIIAHFGRCFCLETFQRGLKKLGADASQFYYDTAAVINPDVYKEAFSKLDHKKILFGTDLPLTLWHGKRRWVGEEYINLCREDFAWNTHIEGEQKEAQYTFFIYEQIKNILDTAQDNSIVNDIFFNNAQSLLENV